MSEELTTDEIVEQLQLNDSESRGIVYDADEVAGMTNNCVEVKHHGRDGTVIVQLMPHIAW